MKTYSLLEAMVEADMSFVVRSQMVVEIWPFENQCSLYVFLNEKLWMAFSRKQKYGLYVVIVAFSILPVLDVQIIIFQKQINDNGIFMKVQR